MLHTRKLAEISSALATTLAPLADQKLFTQPVDKLARDWDRWGVRADLSKSAARIRRRLYAQWRSPLVLHELVSLSNEGWGARRPAPEPDEVGDIIVDTAKLARGIRLLTAEGGKMIAAGPSVRVLQAFLAALGRSTKAGPRELPESTLAVLWALNANESARRIKKQGLAETLGKTLRGWGRPDPGGHALAAELDTLQALGFIRSEDDKFWRLVGEIRFGF